MRWTSKLLCVSLVSLAFASVPSSLLRANEVARPEWGVYQIHRGSANFERGIKAQAALLGTMPQYVLFFQDLGFRRGFPLEAVTICHQLGATPIISQELWEWRHRQSGDTTWLARINRGDFDAQWRDWARAAKQFEQRVILRFGFEMNGDWFDWGQQPEAFIAAWRRVHRIVRDEIGARNVEFMFSPNVEWDTYKPMTRIELYYPGEDYVQLLGLDGYNFGDEHSQWHRWQTFAEVFEASIEIMAQWPHPLYLAEVGTADGPKKASWLQDFLESVQDDSRLSGFIYFNHYDQRKGEPNWLLDSDAATLEVFRRWVQEVDQSR